MTHWMLFYNLRTRTLPAVMTLFLASRYSTTTEFLRLFEIDDLLLSRNEARPWFQDLVRSPETTPHSDLVNTKLNCRLPHNLRNVELLVLYLYR